MIKSRLRDSEKLNNQRNVVLIDLKPKLVAAVKARTIKVQKTAFLRQFLRKSTNLAQFKVQTQTQTPKKLRQVNYKQVKNK